MFVAALSRTGKPVATSEAETASRLHALFPTHSPPRTAAGRVLVAWARLDNRSDLVRDLGCDPDSPDEDLLLAAYEAWGVESPDRLEGDFAYAILDPARRTLFGARDASGVRPFHYAITKDLAAVAASGALLLPFERDRVDITVRTEWLARYVHNASTTWDETPWRGIATLPPGHSLEVTAGQVRVRRWHNFHDDPPWEVDRDPHWLEDYRDALHEAVRARIQSPGPIGVETSGGIDSSTILGLTATLAPERLEELHGFAFVFQDLEPEYALETSRMHRIRQTHVFASARPNNGWDAIGHPPEHSNSTGHIPFYELARLLGVKTLLSGHGGDELVTNTAGQAALELADHRAYRAQWRDLPQRPHRKAAWILRQRLRPFTPVSPMTDALLSRLARSPLTPQAIRDAHIEEILRANSRAGVAFRTVNSFALEGKLVAATSVRTAEGSQVAASYGIDYAWPLLDRRLVQQWLSTPAVWKFAHGTTRYLHRRAAEDVVPAKVIWKPGKEMAPAVRQPQWTPPRITLPTQLHPTLAALTDPDRLAATDHRSMSLGEGPTRLRLLNLHTWLTDIDEANPRT